MFGILLIRFRYRFFVFSLLTIAWYTNVDFIDLPYCSLPRQMVVNHALKGQIHLALIVLLCIVRWTRKLTSRTIIFLRTSFFSQNQKKIGVCPLVTFNII